MPWEQEEATLLACTLIPTADVDDADGFEVRCLEVVARIFAVGGDGCVDVRHTYHHRTGCGRQAELL